MLARQFESKKAEAAYRKAEQRIAEVARDKETRLDLSGLELTSLPPEIGQLASLILLHLQENRITSVPPEIGQLAGLNELRLDNNQLTSVPPEIGQLTSLTELYLHNNQLRTLPQELRRLPTLKALFLHGNPQLGLAASVLGVDPGVWEEGKKGEEREETAPKPGPILDFYFSTVRARDRRPLNEAKLILVGRGDAGKTSLVRPAVTRGSQLDRDFDREVGDAPLRVFYSYSRLDSNQRLKRAKHMSPLERIGLIRSWHDNEILPGAEFNPEIDEKLDESDIILLLISSNFTASDYCMTIELPHAMRSHTSGADDVAVLPVIISRTHRWEQMGAEGVKLGDLNALPDSGKEIPKWKPQDNGWANVAAGVERAAEALLKRNAGRDCHQP